MAKIATILHYCSNDYRFLKRSVQECSRFSDQIIVPFSDHFFDGKEENRFLLERSMQENPGCDFVGFEFDVKRLYSPFIHRNPEDADWLCCWHSTSRYVGSFFVKPEIDWIFFLDADEIVEGDRFAQWLRSDPEEKAIWFNSYMYGLTAGQRKNEWQLTGLLVKKSAITPHKILHPQERCGIFQDVLGKKTMGAVGLDGKPMIHHYSWVRSKEEQQLKAKTWAKKDQRDWMGWLLNDPENVVPYFDPLSVSIPEGLVSGIKQPNERHVTRRQIMELEYAIL